MSRIALVAVENTLYHFDREFSYCIPESTQSLQSGCRVVVPFGKGNSRRQGMVMSVTASEDVSGCKEIVETLDSEPILTAEMLKMCRFMKERFFCTYYDAIRAMLPAGIHYRLSQSYSVSESLGDAFYELDDERRRIVALIRSMGNQVDKDALMQQAGYTDSTVFDAMVDDGILEKHDAAFRRMGDKTVRMARLSDDFDTLVAGAKLSTKQSAVIDLLQSVGAASSKEICYYTGVTTAVLDALIRKGLVVYYDDEVFRIPSSAGAEKQTVTLTEDQQRAYNGLLELYRGGAAATALLYGVTGSGKTSVFFKLIETAVHDGKGVIVMVPEIALTPQLLSVFKAHFGDLVAVFHSALSLGERMDEFKRVRRGMARIALGTRSAIFAPMDDIGLIIVDEEHEHTYKSESKPRFEARELARFRATQHHALLLLSSATPDVRTYYHAMGGDYYLFTLTKRFGSATLPDVVIEDMNEEQAKGNTGEFSSRLLQAIEENLDRGMQSILLLNRRGYNSFVTCNSCKEPISCPNCSISLTYHSANNRLMCHYCGYSAVYTGECPTCHSRHLRLSGTGTQRAEADIAEIFPQARILRMDADTTMTRHSHEKKLAAFAAGEYDIMVGTQMVAKGLDFPKVTLVGVLNADRMLYVDDYRGFENTFSLLTQVVGRSGRGQEKGRAIIQTFTPENPIIHLAASQDYHAFYQSEITLRRAMLYPPFVTMCLVGFVSDSAVQTARAAGAFMQKMKELLEREYADIPLRVLGPSPAAVFKVSNKYRYKLLLKCRNDSRFREMLSRMLVSFSTEREYSSVTVYADMDPHDM